MWLDGSPSLTHRPFVSGVRQEIPLQSQRGCLTIAECAASYSVRDFSDSELWPQILFQDLLNLYRNVSRQSLEQSDFHTLLWLF